MNKNITDVEKDPNFEEKIDKVEKIIMEEGVKDKFGQNSEVIDEKKNDENFDCNTDSNKSNLNFINPVSNIHSSSGSSKEMGNMTPRSINNLNVLFNNTNSRMHQYQNSRRLMTNSG
jgi:hypothetical protein